MKNPFNFNPSDVFGIDGRLIKTEQLTAGHMNYTYKLTFSILDGDFFIDIVLQKVNTVVFKNIDALMSNIFAVTEYLRGQIERAGGDCKRECLNFMRTVDGKLYHVDEDGGCWRAYRFVTNSFCVNAAGTPDTFAKAGAAFGRFGRLLSDFDGGRLNEILADFHNTPARFAQLKAAALRNTAKRKDEVLEELEFATSREKQFSRLVDLQLQGDLPLRVTHNDTKINNVVFDLATGEAICVIDLDTVMPGLSAYDFGDAIRFGANTAAEDERDTSKVSLDLKLFEAYANGYLSEAGQSLMPAERDTLAFGAWLMTMECGMRFLADYLNADVYFRTAYPEHNLVRARTQFALAADMERKMKEMENIVKSC